MTQQAEDMLREGDWPQWSPSRSDGMTGQIERRARHAHDAAMEPVQIGRDDPRSARSGRPGRPAAMEPVQIGRDDAVAALSLLGRGHRRNGARPDRTG